MTRQLKRFTSSAILVACIIVSLFWILLLNLVATGWQDQCEKAYSDGYESGKSEVVIVEDEQIHTMPLFLQKELRWYGVQYADGCIGTHGCGLTAAAMAATYITGDLVTPEYLANASGNEFITDGVNDPDKI